jgi:toluene monooxygenase system ferredoxin subunit
MTEWVEVLDAAELWDGEMTCVAAKGKAVLLIKLGDEIRAYDDRCPHQASSLSAGEFDAAECRVICSAHQWEFDAISGKSVNPTGERMTSFDVTVRDGKIFVLL